MKNAHQIPSAAVRNGTGTAATVMLSRYLKRCLLDTIIKDTVSPNHYRKYY